MSTINIDILNNIKAVIFDMDGVLRIGDKPIMGANKIFNSLHDKNIKTMIVTNECRYTVDELRNDLMEMGINVSNVPIITPGKVIYNHLKKKITQNTNINYYISVIGENGLNKEIYKLNKFENVFIEDNPPTDNNTNNKLILIIGTVNKIKICTLEKALKWIKNKAKIMITCDDTSDPSSKGDFNIGMPRHLLHMTSFTIKSDAYSFGKPNQLVTRMFMEYFDDLKRADILFIGDTMYTDIKLAFESGFRSLLVLSGNTKKEGIDKYSIEPDYVLNNINDFVNIIEDDAEYTNIFMDLKDSVELPQLIN